MSPETEINLLKTLFLTKKQYTGGLESCNISLGMDTLMSLYDTGESFNVEDFNSFIKYIKLSINPENGKDNEQFKQLINDNNWIPLV
jgi:hypothetical protein